MRARPGVGVIAVVAALAAAGLGLSGCAGSGPAPTPTPTADAAASPAPAVSASDWAGYSGVAQLSGGPPCSAALVDTGDDGGPAFLLTAGRCADAYYASPNAVVLGGSSQLTATFGLVAGDPGRRLSFPGTAIPYSTMKGVDLSVVQLGATLGELKAAGLSAYRLATASPGAAVRNAGVPVAGLAAADQVLRASSCTLGQRAQLLEYGWHFTDALSTDCSGVIGGSAGSPLFDASGAIVGIMGASTIGAPSEGGDCYIGKPCERGSGGPTVVADRSYAAAVAGLDACFSAGAFSLGGTCPLPQQGVVALSGGGYVAPDAISSGSAQLSVRLAAPEDTPALTAVVSASDTQACASGAAYRGSAVTIPGVPDLADAAFTQEGVTLSAPIPAAQGVQIFCVAPAGDPAAASWTVFYVNGQPPAVDPLLIVNRSSTSLTVEPFSEPPELSAFRVLWGPDASTDCGSTAAYEDYDRQPVTIPNEQLPIRFCVMGQTLAGVWGDPSGYTVTRDDVRPVS